MTAKERLRVESCHWSFVLRPWSIHMPHSLLPTPYSPLPPMTSLLPLIAQAKNIMNLAAWETTHPPEAIAIVQRAEDAARFLTDAELHQLRELAPQQASLLPVVALLRDQAPAIVTQARQELLSTHPELVQPGGGLYEGDRSEKCGRDLWNFLRTISYGLAGQHLPYTDPVRLAAMRQLYEQVQVPLDAMVFSLTAMKTASLQRVEEGMKKAIAPYFDHLIHELEGFKAN
jgi:hypothetical protein